MSSALEGDYGPIAPANPAGVIQRLSSTSLAMNVGTAQPTYTVPTGKRAVILNFYLRDATGDIAATSLVAGWNATEDNILGEWMHNIDASGEVAITAATTMAGVVPLGVATNVLNVTVYSPVGGALTATIDVFGYLVDA